MTPLAIDFQTGFDNAFQDGIELLPKIGYFLLILIIGIVIAKFVQKILVKILQRVGFDALVERGGVKTALAKSKYDAATILARIVYYFIFLLVVSAAFGVFGNDNPVSAFLAQIIAFLPNLFVAVLVLVIAAAIAAAVKDLLANTLGGLSYGATLANVASLFVVGIGVFFALDQLDIAPLITGGIFYALLALIVIPPIIAFGVGGIDPAREAIRTMQTQSRTRIQEVREEVANDEYDDEQDVPAPAAAARRTTRATTAKPATTRRRRPTS